MPNATQRQTEPKRLILTAALLGLTALAYPCHAFALSEVGPDRDSSQQQETDEGRFGLPLPDPLIDRNRAAPSDSAQDVEEPGAETDAPAVASTADIILDLSTLPAPVRRMRELIVEAAASGDIEQLRSLTNPGPRQTQVSGEIEDPIDAMKSLSGDPDGQEILAIILDIFATGAARTDAGTPDEAYVWPYFAEKQLSMLTPPERVGLLRIVTAGDLMGMEEAGNYNFYRLAITPDGEWKSFSGGD